MDSSVLFEMSLFGVVDREEVKLSEGAVSKVGKLMEYSGLKKERSKGLGCS
jgi:hypothetical protein